MYDRYGREDHASYVPAPADDSPLPPPPRRPSGQKPPVSPPMPPHPHEGTPDRGLLAALHLEDLDTGDLLLLALLFLLSRRKADEELLIALGLLLIM